MGADVAMSFAAAALTAICSAPQQYRAARSTRGLSASAWLQSYVLGAIWGTYGVLTGAWVLAASEGLFAAGAAAILWHASSARRWLVDLAVATSTIVVGFVVLAPAVCLVLASIASVTARLAQIVAMLRARSAAGVATSTWLLLAASNVAWSAAGALRGDVYFTVSAAAGGLSSLTVVGFCWMLTWRNRSNVDSFAL